MIEALPSRAPLDDYRRQAARLLAGHRAADPEALGVIHRNHPRFLDDAISWLPKRLSAEEIAAEAFGEDDAQLAVARWYGFLDWAALVDLVSAATAPGSPTQRFETAVDAVIDGDLATLDALLGEDPGLVHARSVRRTCHEPAVHGATLLHYLAANGVEGYRQRSPLNAVAVARRLLDAGAEVDALAGTYGGQHATLPLLVSSSPPADAGVQGALAATLLDYGAAVDGVGQGAWSGPLRTALVFGFRETAELLASRGATIDLVAAAGLGRGDDVRRLWPGTAELARQQAFALACQLGRAEVVGWMLDQGADPNRFNPEGFHSHATPLHQAALAGHHEVVSLLLARGARADLVDRIYRGTAREWAVHAGQSVTARLLPS